MNRITVPFFILFVFQCNHIFLYDATLIIRYDEASQDLRIRLRSGYQDRDILDAFTTQQKESVCNEVIAAREYAIDASQVSAGLESSVQYVSDEGEDAQNPIDQMELAENPPTTTIKTESGYDDTEVILTRKARELRNRPTRTIIELDETSPQNRDVTLDTTDQAPQSPISPRRQDDIDQGISSEDYVPSENSASETELPPSPRYPASIPSPEEKFSIEEEDTKIPRRKRSFNNRNMKMNIKLSPALASPSLPAETSSRKGAKKMSKYALSTVSSQSAGLPTSWNQPLPSTKGKGILQQSTFKTSSPKSRLKTSSTLPSQKKSLLQMWSLEELPQSPAKFKSRYKKRLIRIPGYGDLQAYSLKCLHTDERQLFIMYGLRRTDLFLLQNDTVRQSPKLAVTGLVTQTPYVKWHQHNSSELQTTFLRQLEIGEDKVLQVPENMHLCFLDKNEHLRLCAATFEALVEGGFYKSQVLNINWVTVHSDERCLTRTVYINEHVYVNNAKVVPCAVNKAEGYADPQHYILPYWQGKASAFILAREVDSHELTVILTVEYVDVLFDLDFSRKFSEGKTGLKSEE